MQNELVGGICAEDVLHYQDLARQYTRKSINPIFEGEHSDGNLSLLPERLETAFKIGIAAAPDESFSGYQYGIWGGAIDEQGLLPSMLLLSIIAETCGGVAMCLHAQGVATNLILQSKKKLPFTPLKVGLCLQEGLCPPYLGTIMFPDKDMPAKITTILEQKNDHYIMSGSKSFVYSMSDTDAYVVLARVNETWGCFLLSAKEKGINKTDVGVRTGMRACCVEHIEFDKVKIPLEARIDDENAREMVIHAMGMNWMGMAAVAVGIARGAAVAARKYAAERYQGGAKIEEHAAVKMLIAGAEASIVAAEATVFALKNSLLTTLTDLRKAASVKLSVIELCSRAVTDCLQTFGGYGYMEDYGMEKRLRDVTVLKSAFGSPTYLKQLIFDIEKEGSR
jgi:hypothetical protein